jgi:hypothetical protein
VVTSRHNILQYLDYICIFGESTWLCHEQIQCIRINNETRLPTLYPDTNYSSKALNYRLCKKGVSFENYLEILKDKNLFLLCRFRTSNHRIPIRINNETRLPTLYPDTNYNYSLDLYFATDRFQWVFCD